MKDKQHRLRGRNRRIAILIILCHALLLTACAGQKAAQDLAGLEMSTMLEYKRLINNSISEETKYYKTASEQLKNNLKEMKHEVVSENTLARRAVRYDDLWRKSPPSQHDVLVMIDAVYADFGAAAEEFYARLIQLDEQYLSRLEKLNVQQDNIDKSIAALSKLYARDEFNERTNIIKDYLDMTLRRLSGNKDKEKTNGQ